MTDLNSGGMAYARSLIAAGSINKTAPWAFSAADGNALLGGKGDDWANYARHHLGVDRAETDQTKARWKYPFAKGGTLYRSALMAIRQRAAAQGDTGIFDGAGELMAKLMGLGQMMQAEHRSMLFEYKLASNEAAGTFEGYGSVFGNEDSNGDLIMPHAFDETLKAARRNDMMPKMLLNHGMGGAGMQINAEDMIPVGVWSKMSADTHGLQCKGRLINLDTESGKRIYGAMKEGALSGLSIGYIARNFTWGAAPNEPRRTIDQVDLFEVSPVTFPGNAQAGVTQIKGLSRLMAPPDNIRDYEEFLRDVGGFSHAAAKRIALHGFKTGTEPREEDGLEVVPTLARLAAAFRT